MTISPADRAELEHLRDGGKWCLDGRKERRLSRLGLIELRGGGWPGWKTSKAGIAALEDNTMEGKNNDG